MIIYWLISGGKILVRVVYIKNMLFVIGVSVSGIMFCNILKFLICFIFFLIWILVEVMCLVILIFFFVNWFFVLNGG